MNEAKLVEKKLWMWRAWTAPRPALKGKVMIADCGIVWAETLERANVLCAKVAGGPYYNLIRKISVEPVLTGDESRTQIACMMADATDGTETLDNLETLAGSVGKPAVS